MRKCVIPESNYRLKQESMKNVASSMIVLSNQWKRRFQFAFSFGVIKNMQILLTKLMLIFIQVELQFLSK